MTFTEMVDRVVQRRGWDGFVQPLRVIFSPRYNASWRSDDVFVVSTEAGTTIMVWVNSVDLWLVTKGTLSLFTRRESRGLADAVLNRLPDGERVLGLSHKHLSSVALEGAHKLAELRLKGEICG